MPSRLEPDLRLQRAVEVDALHHHLRERQGAAELADEAGRVERGAARQLRALDEHDVIPAEPREPVEDRAAADPAADHDRAGARPHRFVAAPGTARNLTRARGARPACRSPGVGPQFARNSFGRGLDRHVLFCKSPACAEHGAPVGRSPPRSTTRKRMACREGGRKRSRLGEFLRPALGKDLGAGRFFLGTRASSVICSFARFEKKKPQFAETAAPRPLTALAPPPSVLLAPSTERPRLMVLRRAAGASWWSVGKPDEGATGSVHFLFGLRSRRRRRGKSACRNLREIPSAGTLTRRRRSHRVALAPSTERLRSMALRAAPASAEVGRSAGRGRHRLGASHWACLVGPAPPAPRALLEARAPDGRRTPVR